MWAACDLTELSACDLIYYTTLGRRLQPPHHNKESVRGEKEVNDTAARNKTATPVQIFGQRLEGLMPDGVPGAKLENGTKLAMMKRGTVSRQLTARS